MGSIREARVYHRVLMTIGAQSVQIVRCKTYVLMSGSELLHCPGLTGASHNVGAGKAIINVVP